MIKQLVKSGFYAFMRCVIRSTPLYNIPPNLVEHNFSLMTDDYKLSNCFYSLSEGKQFNNLFVRGKTFLDLPDVAVNDNPFNFVKVKREQLKDPYLFSTQTKHFKCSLKSKLGTYPIYFAMLDQEITLDINGNSYYQDRC